MSSDYYDRRHRSRSPSPYHSRNDNDSSFRHWHHRQRSQSRERRIRRRSRSRDRSDSRRRRNERYHDDIASGLDGRITPGPTEASEFDTYSRRSNSKNNKKRQNPVLPPRPSAFLAIHGLPENVDEVQLRALFAPIPGILHLTLWKEEGPTEEERKKERQNEGTCRENVVKKRKKLPAEFLNTATLEMHTMATAATLLASEWKGNAYYNEHRLHLEYQRGMMGESDWMCTSSFCSRTHSNSLKNIAGADNVGSSNVISAAMESSTINYAWRSQCFKCNSPRTPSCPAVEPDHQQKHHGQHQEQALLEANWEPKAFDEAAVDVEQEQIKDVKKEKVAIDQDGGYEFDPASGYLTHTSTGYLYDSNTGLYFHPQLQQWGTVNMSTGQFEQYESKKSTIITAPSGGGGTKAAKVAVIGAAPQINTEALRLAEEERKERKLQQEEQLLVDTESKHTCCGGGDGGSKEQGKKSAPAGAGSNAPAGQVQGVVHRGKWAQRRAAVQQQQQHP